MSLKNLVVAAAFLVVIFALAAAITGANEVPILPYVFVVLTVILSAYMGNKVYTRLDKFEQMMLIINEMSEGNLSARLSVDEDDEIAQLSTSINRLLTQLKGMAEEAEELSEGDIGVEHLIDRVLERGRLSEVDLPLSTHQGSLNYGFTKLTNQLRRLTVQAHIIANDQLYSDALDDSLPGELGEAFGLMFESLRNVADRAQAIADGDLTGGVEGSGALNASFNSMIEGLRDLMYGISQGSIQISTSADEMFHVLREQELSASNQAALVQQTHGHVSSLTDSAKQIAKRSESVTQAAEQSNTHHKRLVHDLETLRLSVDRISEIIKVIQTFADRSDLLALNAGLEATRAGEAGKGFGLLAGEMRRLAESIKGSAEDIKELVAEVRVSVDTSRSSAREGQELSHRATQQARTINQLTQQQRQDTEEVRQSMNELATLIHQHAAGTGQVTEASNQLSDLSERLRTMIGRFHLSDQEGQVTSASQFDVRAANHGFAATSNAKN